jgi:membrane protein DedA with SNARE-associated domain
MATWLALAIGTLGSEDLTTIAAGVLVGRGELPAWTAVLACGMGIYLGDLGLWIAGRVLATRALTYPRVIRLLPPGGPGQLRDWIERHPRVAVLGSRFTPGTRVPLYLAAGACRVSFMTFARWSLAAVAVWTPMLIGLSAAAGERVSGWIVIGRIGVIVIAVTGFAVWRLVLRIGSTRRRQQLAASLSRAWRWEFWPMWLFYIPVAVWTAYLAIRHGGYCTITAANPGMPDGGVVGESKFSILCRLPADATIPTMLIEPGPVSRRRHLFRAAVREQGWTYPLVLKPDVGQRGAGVRVVRNADVAMAYLRTARDAVIVQPYHAGPYEAGVFYYRMPEWSHGRILCVTDKHFPAVIGDGRSTLEDLVWRHPRHRMQARTFLSRLGERRYEIAAAGERVPLGIAGNHAQGAMFTDGKHLITPQLEARIDELARAYDGFFIGRFDIRYSDRAAFMAGRDLAVVELNGATAECTNIYDPASSLVAAYRQLFRQWRLVFEIGSANRRAGRPATSPRRLRALLRAHLTTRIPLPVSD